MGVLSIHFNRAIVLLIFFSLSTEFGRSYTSSVVFPSRCWQIPYVNEIYATKMTVGRKQHRTVNSQPRMNSLLINGKYKLPECASLGLQ